MSSNPIGETGPAIPGYLFKEEIGRGATSRVYRARQHAIDRDVAVKVITTEGFKGERRAERLSREARTAGALTHPGIVRAIDAGEGAGFRWYAMELVEGQNLDELVAARGGPLPAREVLQIGLGLLDALEHAHEHGVVHRDIKPANVLLDAAGVVHVLDLGLAQREVDTRLTQEGSTLGTPQFMSPEQAARPDRVDRRSDLFSVAGTLWFLLTGRAPFGSGTLGEVLSRLLYEQPLPLPAGVALVPDGLEAVLRKSLQKEPHRRHRTAALFKRDLQAVALGRPPRITLHASGSRRRGALLLTAGVLVASVAAAFIWWPDGEPTPRENAAPRPGGEDPWPGILERIHGRRAEPGSDLPPRAWLERLGDVSRLLAGAPPSVNEQARDVLVVLREGFREAVSSRVRVHVEAASASLEAHRFREADEQGRAGLAAILPEGWVDVLGDSAMARGILDALREARGAYDQKRREMSARLRAQMLQMLSGKHSQAWYQDWLGGPVVLERSLREDLAQLADPAVLEGEDLRAVETRLAEVVQRILAAPHQRAEAQITELDRLVREQRYLAALAVASTLETVSTRHHATAAVYARDKRRAIHAAMQAVLQQARKLRRLVERPATEGLTAAELHARLRRLDAGLAALPAAEEVTGLAPEVEDLRLLRAALAQGAGLRAAALEAAVGLAGSSHLLTPKRLGEPALRKRRLLEVRGQALQFAALEGGVARKLPVAAASTITLDAILAAAGRPVPAVALALLAHLDGEDAEAEHFLARIPGEREREVLGEVVRAGWERRLAVWESEPERQAARTLAEARKHWSRKATGQALLLLEGLWKAGHAHPLEGSRFWRRQRSEVLRLLALARRRSALEKAFAPYAALGLTWEPGGRRVSLSLDLTGKRLPPPAILTVPRGGRATPQGLLLDAAARLPAARPEEVPALELHLPEVQASRLEVGCEVLLPAGRPAGFLALELRDSLTFLGLDHLRDAGPFRGEPLHGLEDGLWWPRPLGVGLLYRGNLGSYRKYWNKKQLGFQLPTGSSLQVLVVLDAERKKAQVNVGGRSWSLRWPGARFRAYTLALRGFPTILVRQFTAEIQLDGRE